MRDPRQVNARQAQMLRNFVLGYLSTKNKKSKTKCQKKRKRRVDLGIKVPAGYTLRQASKHKFILTGPEPKLIDTSHKPYVMATIDETSPIGRKYL